MDGARNATWRSVVSAALIVWIAGMCGCAPSTEGPTKVTLWHQMVPGERAVLAEEVDRFNAENPDLYVEALYKETEELRSGFENASQTLVCPELVYMASDPMGTFQEMRIVRDMTPWFSPEELAEFLPEALIYLPANPARGPRDNRNRPPAENENERPRDSKLETNRREAANEELVQIGTRIGNHLALVYNRNLLERPPETTDELVEMAVKATRDLDGDGRVEQYGLVWNYNEPYFAVPFLTGFGAWLFADESELKPSLNTPEAVAAYEFIAELQRKHRVAPKNCDYESADALFKAGQAAMIINGDWSWNEYLQNDRIDAAIAKLPIVTATGLPMRPLISPKGFSLSAIANEEKADAAMRFVKYMVSAPVQRRFMERLKILPSRHDLLGDPLIENDPTLRASFAQMQVGRAMPVVAELRAIWDTMRPPYQALLGGTMQGQAAADLMQQNAEQKIAIMNEQFRPGPAGRIITGLGWLMLIAVAIWQIRVIRDIAVDWKRNKLAYWLALPALLVIFITIVFPFVYNIVISVSNMSLRNFKDWQIVGLEHYVGLLTDEELWPIVLKTAIWTFVNVFLHVAIGLFLAVMLNGPVRGKSIYRVILILPWAVPAYITALTWRGMFNYDFGAINLIANGFGLPAIDWLGQPTTAFLACMITNVWLGFPFMMVIALGGMQGIPQELYEAAQIDRASRWRQFWHITVPMLRPVLIPAITLGTVWTFNNLNVIWLVSDGGRPSDKTHILVSYVYRAVFNQYRYAYGAALSMMIFAILLIFCVTLLWKTRATEAV